MNIEIIANEDENFKINVTKFGEQFLASDGERTCIEPTPEKAEDCVEQLQQGVNPVDTTQPKPAPLENPKVGHPFDFFSGTSWAGKRNNFN